MRWLIRMIKKNRDPEQEELSRELSKITDRSVVASKRLDHLATLEKEARLKTLMLQAEVLSRSGRRGKR